MRLPVDEHIPAILEAIRNGENVVIEAAPGAGKTTRVPPALLSVCAGNIIVLEPRRIAARMAARRVADEMGVRLGAEVGYQVRFEEVASQSTRLRYVTEGVLTRRMITDPALRGVSLVVLDEFHERHIDTDLALALLRRLQLGPRPELRLVVMSATLDAEPVARFLGGARRVRSEGRLFPIEVEYAPSSSAPLEEQVARAVERALVALPNQTPANGDVLVFLPGAAEIGRARSSLEPLARKHGLLVTPLHGDLSAAEQDLAVQRSAQRKVILSTNIAESSVTIDGVTAVVDSGLARIASDSPWTGLPSLHVAKISKASAEQRAGRAGRTAPGRVIRLYPREDFARRPEFDIPEIRRRELSQTVLDLNAMGVRDLEWFEPPPAGAWDAAVRLLELLDAKGEAGSAMARLPLHPRLARLVVEAERRGAAEEGCRAAAVLSAGERLNERASRHDSPSDILLLMESNWQRNTGRVFEQLKRFVKTSGRRQVPAEARNQLSSDEAIGLAVLAAFPDRLARRRAGRDLVLASGPAVLAESSVCRAPLMVAVDVEERRDRGVPLVRLASAVEPEWLIDLFPDRVEERRGVEWNRGAERVEAVDAILFDGLVIEETRGSMPDAEAAARLLAEMALEADVGKVVEREALAQFLARADFARLRVDVPAALTELCVGRRSFAELAAADLLGVLAARLLPVRLDEVAPARLKLPSGRSAKVEYAIGQTPWVSSRLQDFFGMRETPRIGGVPLVVHLLAPNQRPVQVTVDLAGFWERLYPQVRRELSRRYPRHAWPEKPV